MNANKVWYAVKRDEMYRAYQAAIEMEEMDEAQRLYAEYERYDKMASVAGARYTDLTHHFGENI